MALRGGTNSRERGVVEQTARTRTASQSWRRVHALAEGQSMGRFILRRELGAGGMGRVFEAYDPVLERLIAVKVLHEPGENSGAQSLFDEAKVLAQLDHPNVVKVHDVGNDEGVLFIAMELVRGGTLKDWLICNHDALLERRRRVIGFLLEAGRGLAAAHAEGLVHRDVKPSNVLIGSDGVARIADFGIAAAASGTSQVDAGNGVFAIGDAPIGTPAYMAPEQLHVGEVGPEADQYAYCVMAWEALFGRRPQGSLRRFHFVRGAFDKRLVRLLKKGLRSRPGRRHRDLLVVLRGLESALYPEAKPRRALQSVALGFACAGGAFVWALAGEDTELESCNIAADLELSWNPEVRARLKRRFRGLRRMDGTEVFADFEQKIDDYTERWSSEFRGACEATFARDEQSIDQLRDQRKCLEFGRSSLRAGVGVLSEVDPTLLRNAGRLAATLPPPEDCREHSDWGLSEEASDLGVLAEVRSERAVGRPKRAAREVDRWLDAPEPLTPPLRARLLVERGLDRIDGGKFGEALEAYREAYALGRSLGADTLVTEAALGAARSVHRLSADRVQTQRWLARAQLKHGVAGQVDDPSDLWLAGLDAWHTGSEQVAMNYFGWSIATFDASLRPSHFSEVAALTALKRRGRPDAIQRAEVALLAGEAEFGSASTQVMLQRAELVEQLVAGRELAEAVEVVGEVGSLAVADASPGWLSARALLACSYGSGHEEGVALARAAIRKTSSGPSAGGLRPLRAHAKCSRGRGHEWVRASEAVLQATRSTYDDRHPLVLGAHVDFVESLVMSGHSADAKREFALALAVSEQTVRDASINVATAFAELGVLAVRLQKPDVGKDLLSVAERQVQLAGSGGGAHGSVLDGARCVVHRGGGQSRSALRACRRALSREQDEFDSSILRRDTALAFATAGEPEVALEELEEAARLRGLFTGPHSGGAAVVLIEIAERLEQSAPDQAARLFEQTFEIALSIGGGGSPVRSGAGLARALALAGRDAEARDTLADVSELVGGGSLLERGFLLEAEAVIDGGPGVRGARDRYARALQFFQLVGDSRQIDRLCRHPAAGTVCATRGGPSASETP